MYQIAVYGKGGIGKSTISSNISYQLAKSGYKIIHIGCDPKHDSTRPLLNGRDQVTILDYINRTPSEKRQLSDILIEGSQGIRCAESGGPAPGIGCAGRGVLTSFNELNTLGIDGLDCDFKIFDVLGDVVCGGFAVPMRVEYSDAIIIVTSGEFMSMYAANNIMKGLLNFNPAKPRLMGIVLNCRGVADEEEMVTRFANHTGTRIIAKIPRDSKFETAELSKVTVSEMYPDSEPSKILSKIASVIQEASQGKIPLHTPRPLEDQQLFELAAGKPLSGYEKTEESNPKHERPYLKESCILRSCSARGAFSTLSSIPDAAVIVHGPASCGFIFGTWSKGISIGPSGSRVDDYLPPDNAFITEMDENASIRGGLSLLRAKLDEVLAKGYRTVFVITCCIPAIIGDNVESLLSEYRGKYPDTVFRLADTQGDITGDFNAGERIAISAILDMMDPETAPVPDTVNIIRGTQYDKTTVANASTLEHMLDLFGLRINCRLLVDGSTEDISRFGAASLNLFTSYSMNSEKIRSLIDKRLNRSMPVSYLPVGRNSYISWLNEMAELTGRRSKIRQEIEKVDREYSAFLERFKLDGQKILVSNIMSRNIDWLIDLLLDMGAEILLVGYGQKTRAGIRESELCETATGYTWDQLVKDASLMGPDLVICDFGMVSDLGFRYLRTTRTGYAMDDVYSFGEKVFNSLMMPKTTDGWRIIE